MQMRVRDATAEALAQHLRGVHSLAGGAVPPRCAMDKGTIVAGIHTVRVKITDEFNCALMALFFTDSAAQKNQFKAYRHCAAQSPQRSINSNTRGIYGGTDDSESGAPHKTRELEEVFPDAEHRCVSTSFAAV
jgi:hypothetical protein